MCGGKAIDAESRRTGRHGAASEAETLDEAAAALVVIEGQLRRGARAATSYTR